MRNLCKSPYLPLAVLFAYMLFLHRHLNFTLDDIGYSKVDLTLNDVIGFYRDWSSRIIISPLTVYVTKMPIEVWRIADSAMAVLLCAAVARVTTSAHKINFTCVQWATVVCFAFYNYAPLGSAGWVATTLNYLWPMTCFWIALILPKKIQRNEYIPSKTLIMFAAALIFALDSEMIALMFCVMLVCYAGRLLWLRRQRDAEHLRLERLLKKYRLAVLVYATITIVMLAKIVLCPGNKSRYITESKRFFPDFEFVPIIDKLQLGIGNTGAYFFYYNDCVTVFLCVATAIIVWQKSHNKFWRLAALLPLVLRVVPILHLMHNLHTTSLAKTHEYFITVSLGIGMDVHYLTVIEKLPVLYAIAFFALLAAILGKAFYGTQRFFYVLTLYASGLATTLAVSFSPTLFASSTRIFFPLHFVFVVLTVICITEILHAEVSYNDTNSPKSAGKNQFNP